MLNYEEFIKSKEKSYKGTGLKAKNLNPKLFDFQAAIVEKSLENGRYANFCTTGLGKSFMQMEFAKQVSSQKNIASLILAPLAVSGQTIREGEKFGIEVQKLNGTVKKGGVYIINYDQLDNVDCKKFGCIVPDECFPEGTMVETLKNGIMLKKDITAIRKGDFIKNAYGVDRVTETHRREIKRAIKITIAGKQIIASENHPFFTQWGWVSAINLTREHCIIQTAEAMHLVHERISASETLIKERNEILREILFSEMEDETTRYIKENPQPGSCGTAGKIKKQMAYLEFSGRDKRDESYSEFESDVESRDPRKSEHGIATNEIQAFRAWGQWDGNDRASGISSLNSFKRMESGICYITGQKNERLPDELQAGLSELFSENRYRSGWTLSPSEKRARRKEGQKTGFYGVESFEVLELGHPELERFRNAEGVIYFYDIKAERHPSFSVEGFLVHNSSILKSFDGKTKQKIVSSFMDTEYKLPCTATPSPNDPMELGNHAEFLNIMSRNEMLAMYFVHDGGDTAKWRIKKYGRVPFYKWIASWATIITKPSDLGYPDGDFILPPLNIIEKKITTDNIGESLFNELAVSATDFNKGLRETMKERLTETAYLSDHKEPVIIWVKQDAEADYLKDLIPEAIEVRGNQSREEKEEKLLGFAKGDFRVLITKTKIASYGLNLQNCNNQIFPSLDFSFESLFQAIRRSYRYGQKKEVNIHILATDRMSNVIQSIKEKEKQWQYMISEMVKVQTTGMATASKK